MISKELLSEVLGYEVLSYDGTYHTFIKNGITYANYPLNIYEVAYKCKEWVWDNGYQLRSSYKSIIMDREPFCEVISTNNMNNTSEEPLYMLVTNQGGISEPEAIFNACEWVYKEKEI